MKILKEREGIRTFLTEEGRVAQVASTPEGHSELANAYRFLKRLEFTPYVPKGVEWYPDKSTLFMDYVEETPITNEVEARQNAILLLNDLREFNIIHGDLTRPNVRWHDNIPVVLDWGESTFALSSPTRKRPEPDIVHLLPHVIGFVGDTSRILRRWMAIRPHIAYYFEWGTFLDLGCHEGDFCGLAKAEGMRQVWGFDNEQISPCLKKADELWGEFGVDVEHIDIVQFMTKPFYEVPFDIVMMFSTWAYIVQKYGAKIAMNVLTHYIDQSNIFLFETQLFGDGPGPEFLGAKEDVEELLYNAGATSVIEVITIPVVGRDAERTVWVAKG